MPRRSGSSIAQLLPEHPAPVWYAPLRGAFAAPATRPPSNPEGNVAPRPPDERKQIRRVLFWVGALAVAVRLLYFAEHSGSAFFGVPVLDEKFYDTVARALAEGRDFSAVNPGFRPLLYPLFLAFLYRLGGDWGFAVAGASQHLLGVATAVLVGLLAIRLHRRPAAGALAGTLFVLAGPVLFFEGELLITTLFTFLATALLTLLSRADLDLGRLPAWLAAGLVTGLAAQARPNVLLFLAAFPLAALVFRRRAPLGARLLLPAAALAGTAVTLLAFATVQSRWIDRFQLLPTAGGINFYLGNKAGADGMIPRQDTSVTYGEEYRDSVQVFAVEAYRRELPETGPVAPAAVSRYWTLRTLGEIRGDPGRWLALMGRKLLFLLWNREIPNNKNYAFVRAEESPLLRVLPVRWWLLFSLTGVGCVHAGYRGDRRLLFWIAAFLALFGLGLVLFFVNSRYRIPMWPAMAVLASGAPLWLAECGRRRSWGRLAAGAAASAVLAALSLTNWLAVPPHDHGRDFFFRSLAHLQQGDLEAAAADARRSVELEPADAAAQFQLGNTALAGGDLDAAFMSYMAAGELAPDEPRIFNNLGILYERWERPIDAYRCYLVALSLAGDYPPALVNAALLELRASLADRAATKLRRATDLGFDSVALTSARAFLALDEGRGEEAAKLLEIARRRDPEAAARLLASQRPLHPADIGVQPQ